MKLGIEEKKAVQFNVIVAPSFRLENKAIICNW